MFRTQAFGQGRKGECGPGRHGFDKAWKGKFGHFWGRHAAWHHQVPVNIEETDASYFISLFAAGLNKEKITLTVKDDVLTVAYQGSEPSTAPDQETSSPYTYQEHTNPSFERSFRLNDKVLTESISANYTDGVLRVTLPKNPDTNKPAQTISVE
ncbi:Hsp20/alpha crystallin family protein [Spirosoma koreense]